MSKFIVCALCGHRWAAASGVRFGRFPGERFWPVSGGAVWLVSGGRGVGRSGRLRLRRASCLLRFEPGVEPYPSVRTGPDATWLRLFGRPGVRVASVALCGPIGPVQVRRGVPHSVRAVPSSPFWPRKSLAGRLVSFGSGPGRNLFRWFWWLRMCRRFRLFGRFRLLRGPVVREAPVACRGFVRRLPALLSSGPHLGGTGGFSLLRAARPALRGLSLDKSSEKARTGLNYS